ncbi:MAG: protein phosphatase 2C domain-containing protein [Muribaculaceae bacterium]|nr:protein phosphatase 2C domain-containing protein [Alistipes senegalensis]MCM1473468.1 protein phosphatase 2C domain-containing protein [Muribaculaceae bacterium]
MFSGFSRSIIGASHVRKNIVCQDSSGYELNENYAVAVVADGHGSRKHFRSNIGSQMAVDAAVETVRNFFSDYERISGELPENHDLILKNVEKQVIARWRKKIIEHFSENPVRPDEKKPFSEEEFRKIPIESYYGTTLVAAVIGKDFSLGFQIGDGTLVAVFEDGETVMIMDYEESNPANITASVCNKNAPALFNHFYTRKKKILAMFVSTDGLYTSFSSDYDFLDYHTIIAGQLYDIQVFESTVIKNITKRTHFGTEDDISLSCVYNKKLSSENIMVLRNKTEENKRISAARKAHKSSGR